MENFSVKKEDEEKIPRGLLEMYKIEGYGDINYKKYLLSKNIFQHDNTDTKENRNSLLIIKDNILNQEKDKIGLAIREFLQDSNIEVQRIASSLIDFAQDENKGELQEMISKKILESLNNPDIEVQRIAMNMIKFASENSREELRNIVFEKIKDAFNSEDIYKQKIMAKKIIIAPENRQEELKEVLYKKILEALGKDSVLIQRYASTMIRYAPENRQEELKEKVKIKYELAKASEKYGQIIEPSLYFNESNASTSIFSHNKLSKTGSETTLLLGDKFRNNIIMRRIERPCFMAWQEAYEGYQEWKKAGFEYVPIEPMVSFRNSTQKKFIDVASGVLDLNLEEWYSFSGETFKEELEKMKKEIVNVLLKMKITHGHVNDANFCLRFSRNKNSIPDINILPRIYLIDFDKAIINQ